MTGLPDYVAANRTFWDDYAPEWVARGERSWSQPAPTWGEWGVPDADVPMLPAEMTGMTAIELGCGTGYISAWMVRRGADVVAIDNSAKQLEAAMRLADEHHLDITWMHGNAEAVPLPNGSFDYAINEYGAAMWCDPFAWIPEAHRLLRRGGELAFLTSTPLVHVCTPLDGSAVVDRLVRPTFGLHMLDWRDVEIDPGGVSFNLPLSRWFRLFRETGFAVVDFVEIQAPDPTAPSDYEVPAAWAHDHPSEMVWRLRKIDVPAAD